MNKPMIGMLALLLGGGVTTYLVGQAGSDGQHQMPALPAPGVKSSVVVKVVQPFHIDEAATHYWRAEQPKYNDGYVLVLSVDRDLVHPRQAMEPVLYVGNQTAERVNLGSESGYVVAIVPSVDLPSAPIFFGEPGLPEEIDQAMADRELAAAIRAGVAPTSSSDLASATRKRVEFENDYQLRLWAADLIEEFSPMERDLISGLRAPLVGE